MPKNLKTPEEIAAFEAANFLKTAGGGIGIDVRASGEGDGFVIRKEDGGFLVSGGSPGVLYGTYALIGSLLCGETPEEGPREPENPYRILECWDNLDGSIERGYSGRSFFFKNGEIIVNDDNEWECPQCHNKDHAKMNVTRRTCGYLGENFWNVGKTKEIKARVLHL